ncbi:MAG: M13 family metallopeptidase [Gemmatimonadales bacterium]
MPRNVSWAALLLVSACSPPPSHPAQLKPQYGAWGFDLAGEDTTARPGDDFFGHVNGGWLGRTAIPADKASVSLWDLISDTTEARLRAIMDAGAAKAGRDPSDLEGKIGAYYKAFMDSAAVETLGAAPLAPHLARVRAAATRGAIAALMGRTNLAFDGAIFSTYIDVDLKNPKIYTVYLNQAGLGLPDRDYYLKPEFAAPRAAYEHYAATLLHLIDWPDPDGRAKEIVAFEKAIAQASWTKVQQRDLNAEYNPMTVADLVSLAPGFDWNSYLESAGLPRLPRVVVGEKSAFPRIAAVFASTPLPTLQAWEAFTIADNAAPFLSRAFGDAFFELRRKTLAGQHAQAARWKRAVQAVGGGDFLAGSRFERFGSVGFGVGELYTAKYFPPGAKKKIEELVANLMAAYRARIEKLDWMGPATRQEALKKLETYTIKVGYPDHPRDYSRLRLRDDDLLGDAERAGAFDWQFYVDRLNGPVDRTDWAMTPQTTDAYNGSLRDIVFPAGILQPPIFDPNADMAVNYGATGSVIGHELTHGFDDEGRKIDAEGALRDWWAPADAKAFDARAKVLATQYSAFEPLPGLHLNGNLTLGENIADLGGVTLALDAYRASLHGRPAPVLDGLTGDQRVFIGWAQAWRGKVTDDALKRQVVSNPHSPERFRVNGPLQNIDAWYTAFEVKPGDRLYVAPENRVRIW